MYKVIGSLETRAFRVAWMLNELGQPFTLDPVPPRDASISTLNPSGKVPVLLDGDNAIIDSVATNVIDLLPADYGESGAAYSGSAE